jgi:outer membrane receptor protein involved in Fe transport
MAKHGKSCTQHWTHVFYPVVLVAASVPTQAQELEEIVVTGSRVLRDPNATSSQPVATISSDAFAYAASTDIVEVINDNPALLSSVSSANSLDESADNVGQADNVGGATLNLRGLGYERTLTLVNGRRHVAGIEGTSSVDVSTIPPALIERVEVLTGGASAIYGADAITGVVNFVLKDDFEGFELDVRPSRSSRGDAESVNMSALYGHNFDGGRGNVTVAVQFDQNDGLRSGDSPTLRNNGLANDDVNPARRFQNGDINATTMPNLSRYYDYDNTGLFPFGLRIPSADTFSADYLGEFGESPTLTAEELALINRAATAPPRAILPGRTFNITSPYGVVALGDFGSGETPLGSEPDLDGNGTPDCLQSFTGYNSSLAGAGSFGAVGGCWFINEGGDLVPYVDGLVAGNFNQFGAEQSYIAPNRNYVVPKEDRVSVNINANYDLTSSMSFFAESKFVDHEVEFGGGSMHATDLLYGAPDNPFLPAALAPFANNSGVGFVGPGGLYISRDSDDWAEEGPVRTNERKTARIVAGLEGTSEKLGVDWEVSANYGRFTRDLIDRNDVITDRFFAAIDVVTDPATGLPVCRSDLDATAYPQTTPFNFPNYLGGGAQSPFFTFTPGDGQCQPANIWGGRGSISQEAIDFFTYDRTINETIEQSVIMGFVTGEAERISLPAGPIAFALGAEWRKEETEQIFDDFAQGVLPVSGVTVDGTPFSAGQWVGDVSNASSLGSQPGNRVLSGASDYSVWDVFGEVEIPLLAGKPGAEEMTLDIAVRHADYSTFGGNTTYKFGLLYSPIQALRFRANHSEAVRVPNLFELFSPEQGQNFRPQDPCDVAQISSAPNPALRQANCIASLQSFNVSSDNIFDANGNYIFVDPLSAGFAGVVGGNANLDPETAITKTLGLVVQPEATPGLTFSIDYWEIEIRDAISQVFEQNIVNGCYDAPNLNNPFCELLQRNSSTTSAQSGGFTFLRQTLLNFGAAEASGIDTIINYGFSVGRVNVNLNTAVTKQNKLLFVQPSSPGEPEQIDIELGEMRRPEWSAQFSATVNTGPVTVILRSQFLSEQTLLYEDGAEIETAFDNYGSAAFTDDIAIYDMSLAWDMSDSFRFYGGVSNLTDEKPFISERAYPVSPVGRSYFLGMNYIF